MKKKILAVFTSLIVSAMLFAGCSANFSKVKIKSGFEQDYNYVVKSNGGNAVQYGDYIYFINGTRGYEDTDGKNNVFGKVVKGALYKAKLVGKRDGRDFEADFDPATGLNFVSYKGKVHSYLEEDDEDEEVVDIVDVQVIAPKVIGTSGYKNGGIFIYDDYVYYASPNNTKNKQGTVQVSKTDFFRTKLDGSKTQLIFTTEEDAADKPYAFYKQGDSVYLVCYYGTKIVSVKMTGDKKPESAMVLADNATGALFPTRDFYDSENNITNDPEDFIYYTRDVDENDLQRAGNTVVAMRPDGSERLNVIMNGTTVTLEAVSGGALFYRTTVNTNTVIKMDNLHDVLMDNSPSYKAYEESLEADARRVQIPVEYTTVLSASDMSTYTSLYCFRDNIYANVGHILGFTSSAVYLISNGSQNMRVLNSAATMQFINGNYMYYTNSDGNTLYRTDFTLPDSAKGDAETVADGLVSGGLNADYAAGFVMYFGKVDEWANGYAFFKNMGVEGADAVAVYDRAEADRKPEPSEEETTENTDEAA